MQTSPTVSKELLQWMIILSKNCLSVKKKQNNFQIALEKKNQTNSEVLENQNYKMKGYPEAYLDEKQYSLQVFSHPSQHQIIILILEGGREEERNLETYFIHQIIFHRFWPHNFMNKWWQDKYCQFFWGRRSYPVWGKRSDQLDLCGRKIHCTVCKQSL